MIRHFARRLIRLRSFCRPLVLLTTCGLAACQSTPPPPQPDQMARTTLQTAPADLQLICSDAVATAAKVNKSKVLPVSSNALDATSFNVELNANGRKFNCVVDDKGVVRSVQPV